MINLLVPTWIDLASVVQPTFAMASAFVAACGFLLLRKDA